ncbi:MAG: hypothetical protein V3V39_10085, partial [Desulfobacterales bacterium]
MAHDQLITDYLAPMSPLPTSITPGGGLVGKIQCVLFDIYGTLFISGSGDISVARKASPLSQKLEHLVHKYDVGKTPQALVGELHDTIEIKHRQLRDNGIDYPEIEIDEIWQQILGIDDIQLTRKFAIEYELIVNPVYPMPHLESLLAACRQQNLAMGIISNAQFFTPLLFEWFLDTRMQGVLSKLQKELGITFLYVTHSQSEAFAMADRVVIMNQGEIQQVGTPREVYRAPANRFVAEFVGANNILEGRVV